MPDKMIIEEMSDTDLIHLTLHSGEVVQKVVEASLFISGMQSQYHAATSTFAPLMDEIMKRGLIDDFQAMQGED
jgi:hypothetical protein